MSVEETRREIAAALDEFPQLVTTKQELVEHYQTLTPLLEDSNSRDAQDGVRQLFQAKAGVERADGMLQLARRRAGDYSAFL